MLTLPRANLELVRLGSKYRLLATAVGIALCIKDPEYFEGLKPLQTYRRDRLGDAYSDALGMTEGRTSQHYQTLTEAYRY